MSEHTEQCALFEWAARCEGRAPELALLYAIPNGGARHPAVAAKMKAEGVKAGVPDTHLPVARRGYHGMFIEMKFGANRPTPGQREWDKRLTREGYIVATCWSWIEAAGLLVWYLGYDRGELGL
jgi:hypothetical protein